jgi:hypothetical protein
LSQVRLCRNSAKNKIITLMVIFKWNNN